MTYALTTAFGVALFIAVMFGVVQPMMEHAVSAPFVASGQATR